MPAPSYAARLLSTPVLLRIALALVLVESAIELALVSSTVAWLESPAISGGGFAFTHAGARAALPATPERFLVDQGHTSNGAAGTGLVIVGLGGVLALLLPALVAFLSSSSSHRWRTRFYYLWAAINIPAFLLTLAAFIYVFSLRSMYGGGQQVIDPAIAAEGSAYPLGTWTPQAWFDAVQGLDLVDVGGGPGSRGDVASHARIAQGWQWNLLPMWITQLGLVVLVLRDLQQWRGSGAGGAGEMKSKPGYEV